MSGAAKPQAPASDTGVPYNIDVYASLLGVSPLPDGAAYRREFKVGPPRNADGIPLAFEEQAETVGSIIASAYEERYEEIKAEMQGRGMQFSATVADDEDKPVAVDFAAIAAAPIVSRITDEADLMPYGIAALHWLLAAKEREWVFRHLSEAVGVYYRCSAVRAQLDPGYDDDFDDLRDLLREAFRHYLHRNA